MHVSKTKTMGGTRTASPKLTHGRKSRSDSLLVIKKHGGMELSGNLFREKKTEGKNNQGGKTTIDNAQSSSESCSVDELPWWSNINTQQQDQLVSFRSLPNLTRNDAIPSELIASNSDRSLDELSMLFEPQEEELKGSSDDDDDDDDNDNGGSSRSWIKSLSNLRRRRSTSNPELIKNKQSEQSVLGSPPTVNKTTTTDSGGGTHGNLRNVRRVSPIQRRSRSNSAPKKPSTLRNSLSAKDLIPLDENDERTLKKEGEEGSSKVPNNDYPRKEVEMSPTHNRRRRASSSASSPTVVNPIRKIAQLRQAVITETSEETRTKSQGRSRSYSMTSFSPRKFLNNPLESSSSSSSDGGVGGGNNEGDNGVTAWRNHIAELSQSIVAPRPQKLQSPVARRSSIDGGITAEMKESVQDEKKRQQELMAEKIRRKKEKTKMKTKMKKFDDDDGNQTDISVTLDINDSQLFARRRPGRSVSMDV
eukprot:TRINITY_DN807_c0_g2_i1.p1 TRINITY_DN807_c0_g2~~TRINITY_DN807_c0_g2_i1.p1  ORF type:complete len:476 (+),score=150.65 TRINITY_DN807_c0_g2_i1:444-1871(+)